MMEAGWTFRLVEQHLDIDDHLWVVLSDPHQNADTVLIVSITTFRPEKDRACIIEAGEHALVRHRSCVAYNLTRSLSAQEFNQLKDSGKFEMSAPVSAQLLGKMRASVLDSRMPLKFSDLLEEQGLVPQ